MWYLLNGTATVDSTIFSFFSPGKKDPYFQVDCPLRPNTFEQETGINDELEISQFMSKYFVDSNYYFPDSYLSLHIDFSFFLLLLFFFFFFFLSFSWLFLVPLSYKFFPFFNYTALSNCGSISIAIKNWKPMYSSQYLFWVTLWFVFSFKIKEKNLKDFRTLFSPFTDDGSTIWESCIIRKKSIFVEREGT